MTSMTATVPRATATAAAPARTGRSGGLREAPWVRAALGVAIGGLLVADLTIVLRERADAAAAGRSPLPALRVEAADDAATEQHATTSFEQLAFTGALAGAVSAANALPVVAEDPAAVVEAEVAPPPAPGAAPGPLAAPVRSGAPRVATPPRDTAPPPGLPGLPTVPPVPPAGDGSPTLTGLVESIPLVGPTLAPVVAPVADPLMAEVTAPVADATPADAAPDGGSSIVTIVDGLIEPVTAPLAPSRLLG